jgi:hypothetical protein
LSSPRRSPPLSPAPRNEGDSSATLLFDRHPLIAGSLKAASDAIRFFNGDYAQ